MKRSLILIQFIFFIFTTAAVAGEVYFRGISVPDSNTVRVDTVEAVKIKANKCEVLFQKKADMSTTGPFAQVNKVIEASNKEFKRRNWSDAFLAERFEVAQNSDYAERSEYIKVTLKETDEIVGTIGFTYAHSFAHDKMDQTLTAAQNRDIRPHGIQLIPVETTLDIPLLPRPMVFSESLIFELRTFSIVRRYNKVANSLLLYETFNRVIDILRRQNLMELYDKPILYLYADEKSLELYGKMGFKNISQTPVSHKGSNWWVMVASPKDVEALALNNPNTEVIWAPSQPVTAKSPDGVDLTVSALSGRVRKKANSDQGISAEDLIAATEIKPGLWASKRSDVEYWPSGQLKKVTSIEKNYAIPGTHFVATLNSGLEFDSFGNIQSFQTAQAVEIPGWGLAPQFAWITWKNGLVNVIPYF